MVEFISYFGVESYSIPLNSDTQYYIFLYRYDTMKFMSMNILDCTHYTTVLNTDSLRGVGPLDWVYGIKLSYTVPDTGCERCTQSGGTCGFDTDTEGPLCLCSPSSNYTRECGTNK